MRGVEGVISKKINTIFTTIIFIGQLAAYDPSHLTFVSAPSESVLREARPGHIHPLHHHHSRIEPSVNRYRSDHILQYARSYNQILSIVELHVHVDQVIDEVQATFEDSFEKRSWFDREFTRDISQQVYEQVFYNKLIDECGYNYNSEQLARAHYLYMRHWKEYCYPGFKTFIKKFPLYEAYILALDKELSRDAYLRDRVQETEYAAYEHITQEAHRIKREHVQKQQRRVEVLKQERLARAREIFTQQKDRLESVAQRWDDDNESRYCAYQRTTHNNARERVQGYVLSSPTQRCLKQHGLDAQSYCSLQGNDLQHELLREIITHAEEAAHLKMILSDEGVHFADTLQASTFKTLDTARVVNEMGDCVSASKLIDCARTMLDYCSALVEGVVDGVADGVVGGVMGTYEMIAHPLKTARALGVLAVKGPRLCTNL